MNRYPVWKYIVIAVVVLLGALYTAPNYFGESPALQITSGKSTVKIDAGVAARVAEVLKAQNLPAGEVSLDEGASHSVRARFTDTDTQFKAKLALERGLNADPNDPT
jgi:preprotein translocase subunit SecD